MLLLLLIHQVLCSLIRSESNLDSTSISEVMVDLIRDLVVPLGYWDLVSASLTCRSYNHLIFQSLLANREQIQDDLMLLLGDRNNISSDLLGSSHLNHTVYNMIWISMLSKGFKTDLFQFISHRLGNIESVRQLSFLISSQSNPKSMLTTFVEPISGLLACHRHFGMNLSVVGHPYMVQMVRSILSYPVAIQINGKLKRMDNGLGMLFNPLVARIATACRKHRVYKELTKIFEMKHEDTEVWGKVMDCDSVLEAWKLTRYAYQLRMLRDAGDLSDQIDWRSTKSSPLKKSH